MDVELFPASQLAPRELAELFTAGYEEYFVPIAVDEAQLEWMVRAWDLDLEASRIARSGDAPVGLALLGTRGDEAWIGGVGVVPSARRQGVGAQLMSAVLDEARERTMRIARLEVIHENVGALALYERLGFRRVRDLEVWAAPGATGPTASVAVEAARRTIAEHRSVREPWQRADATVDKLEDLVGIAAGDAAAIARVGNGRVQLLQAAGTATDLSELVRAAAALGDSVHMLNVDPADPLSEALSSASGRVEITQHELELVL